VSTEYDLGIRSGLRLSLRNKTVGLDGNALFLTLGRRSEKRGGLPLSVMVRSNPSIQSGRRDCHPSAGSCSARRHSNVSSHESTGVLRAFRAGICCVLVPATLRRLKGKQLKWKSPAPNGNIILIFHQLPDLRVIARCCGPVGISSLIPVGKRNGPTGKVVEEVSFFPVCGSF